MILFNKYSSVIIRALYNVCVDLLQIGGLTHGSNLGMSIPYQQPQHDDDDDAKRSRSDILDASTHELKLEKSNILMLGPTGSGNH